jgi:hypothetical protein
MIFHLGFELPEVQTKTLNEESPDLTSEETRILKTQVRKNSRLIDEYVQRLDLLVNKERYPLRAIFIEKIRRRLILLMEENDTFRRVLWRHYQKEETAGKNP